MSTKTANPDTINISVVCTTMRKDSLAEDRTRGS